MNEKLYTAKEVADHFRVSRQAVYDWIAAGKLRALRIGDRVRIPESALQEFVRTIEPGERVEENESGPWIPALALA